MLPVSGGLRSVGGLQVASGWLMAVRNVLQSFAPKLAGLCVKWHTDNQNVVGIGWPEVSGWPLGSQWVSYGR